MAYIISKVFTTKAKYSKDGKEHKHTNYYGGSWNVGLIGGEDWGNREQAKKFDNERTAERYARALGGKVVEVKGQ